MPQGAASSNTFAELDLLALLLSRTEQGFWFIDNALATTDANPAMCRMLRTTREALLGRSIYDYVDEANAAVFRHHVALRSQGVSDGYEITLTAADGTCVDCYNNATPVFDAQGAKVGAIGMFSDISAQKRDQRELARTSALLEQKTQVLERTLQSLAQGVVSVDANGRVNGWNRRMLELLQLPESLLASRPTLGHIVEHQLANGHFDEETRRRAAASLGPTAPDVAPLSGWRGNYRRRTRDGHVLEIDSFGAADGGIVRTYTDITERVRAEEALLAAKDEAERANRAKSEFLSRMSHELRTPLNAILGFGQLLEGDTEEPLSATQRQRVGELQRAGAHLLELIEEVLDLSRIEAGALRVEPTAVALLPLLRECVRMLEPTAASRGVHIEIGASVADAEVGVLADPTRLKQVLLNLLSNAVKYNREGGMVGITVEARGDLLRLSVSDQGAGLTQAQQLRLFQAFERLGAQHGHIEGTGIGLALSRRLMTLMGGQIGVDSREGAGSTFWIELPRSGHDAVDVGVGEQAAPLPPARGSNTGARVLYIEDNEVNQLLMAGMLARRSSIELAQAVDPIEGLRMAAELLPDLVLLDIQLPGLDGFEVLRRLRADPATAQVPVVAVSANAMSADLEAAERAGFDAYLTKPLQMQRLLDTVDRWLGRQRH